MTYFNTDESILDDKDWPRDEYGFRLQPGRQMDKWKLRNANKSLVDYFSICGGKEVTGVATADMNYNTAVKIPLLIDNKGKYVLTGNYPSVITAEYLESLSKTEKIGDSSWGNKEGRVYLPESGIYMIQAQMEFIWQDGTSTPTANSAPKLFYQIDYFGKNGESKGVTGNTYGWGIVNPDSIRSIDLNYFEGGESIGLSALHSRNGVKAFCRGCIKIQKLS